MADHDETFEPFVRHYRLLDYYSPAQVEYNLIKASDYSWGDYIKKIGLYTTTEANLSIVYCIRMRPYTKHASEDYPGRCEEVDFTSGFVYNANENEELIKVLRSHQRRTKKHAVVMTPMTSNSEHERYIRNMFYPQGVPIKIVQEAHTDVDEKKSISLFCTPTSEYEFFQK